jgi:hypothetical protein
VVFNFDALDKTYVYDITDGQGGVWHERATRNPLTDELHRWAPNFLVQIGGQTIVGDRYQPRLLEMGSSYLLEDGNNILRIRTSAHAVAELKYFRVQSCTFSMETGEGISTQTKFGNQYEAPTMMLRYSWDFARTWSSELRETFGRMGAYQTMLQFRRLGRGRQFTVEYKISDPCKTSIMNGYFDYEEGGQRT